jgi:hypothetical protein
MTPVVKDSSAGYHHHPYNQDLACECASELSDINDDDEVGTLHDLGSRWGACHEIVGTFDGHC